MCLAEQKLLLSVRLSTIYVLSTLRTHHNKHATHTMSDKLFLSDFEHPLPELGFPDCVTWDKDGKINGCFAFGETSFQYVTTTNVVHQVSGFLLQKYLFSSFFLQLSKPTSCYTQVNNHFAVFQEIQEVVVVLRLSYVGGTATNATGFFISPSIILTSSTIMVPQNNFSPFRIQFACGTTSLGSELEWQYCDIMWQPPKPTTTSFVMLKACNFKSTKWALPHRSLPLDAAGLGTSVRLACDMLIISL